ncbi:MAG: hypothetical protein ACLGJB_17810 [Blastocatellia bacterium]
MAKGDIRVVDTGGRVTAPTREYQTAAGSTAINAGEPVMLTTIGTSQYVAALTDAKPVIGTDYFVGIAADAATHTASADGVVHVYVALPGVTFRGKAKTAANADTQSEVNALVNKRTIFDLTTGTYTVDTAAADGATNGLIIVGGDPNGSFIDFQASARATPFGF